MYFQLEFQPDQRVIHVSIRTWTCFALGHTRFPSILHQYVIDLIPASTPGAHQVYWCLGCCLTIAFVASKPFALANWTRRSPLSFLTPSPNLPISAPSLMIDLSVEISTDQDNVLLWCLAKHLLQACVKAIFFLVSRLVRRRVHSDQCHIPRFSSESDSQQTFWNRVLTEQGNRCMLVESHSDSRLVLSFTAWVYNQVRIIFLH